jgi:predicted house-cleaning noncanonical NTP pyrophosphatase (MazG superfamily)
MIETRFDKLVRDNIPAIITSNGAQPIVRTLTTDEYRQALMKKLIEEATELLDSAGSLDERADVGEVLAALDEVFEWTALDIQDARDQKNAARGAFTQRIYLEKTITS